MFHKTRCLLCDVGLTPLDTERQAHPEAEDCLVRLCDAWGVVVEDAVKAPTQLEELSFNLAVFPFMDDVLVEIFDNAGVPRLGGQSTGTGWSKFSSYQRCPYLYQQRYLLNNRPAQLVESPSLAIGSLIHTFLAVYYIRMMGEYPLTPEDIYEGVRLKANPEFVETAWRVFTAYRIFYGSEVIQPLAVEHDLVDPRTNDSCRYDLVAYFPESIAGRPAGTYIIESKSASRFDDATLTGWVNDGEVIGEVALWKRLGLDHRFGKLQGVLVNLLGKQKVPQFYRQWVSPESWQITGHLDDLKRWSGLIELSKSSNNFPRARGGCINRYGKCERFESCGGSEQ